MPRAARRPPHRGFSLLEMTLVVTLILVAVGAYLRGGQANPHELVGHAAREIVASMQQALAEASTTGGDAVFYVDVNQEGDRRGKFLAIAGAAGVDSLDLNLGWIDLMDGVQWTNGTASVSPTGEPITPTPATVRCEGRECWLGDADYTAYYIGHLRNPRAVAAILLTHEGAVQIFRFSQGESRWEREVR